MKKKILFRILIFFLICVTLFFGITKVMTTPADYRNYQWVAGFYEEKKESLDAVFIGGSNVYAYYEAPIAWHYTGIAVWPFVNGTQNFSTSEYLIREARKTQPDALYIVSLNALSSEMTDIQLHRLTDYMPFSVDKIKLINYASDLAGISKSDRMEFFFPLIRYHSRWEELTYDDFHYTINGLKGGGVYSTFLGTSVDVRKYFKSIDEAEPLDEKLQEILLRLLDYCDENNVRVLFILTPQVLNNLPLLANFNEAIRIISDRGYPVLNLIGKYDEIGLDLSTDYYDKKHNNIHGAIKTTKYIAEYLVKEYGFRDKRGDAAYASWDASWELYSKELAPYVVDVEWTPENRDFSMDAPTLTSLKLRGTSAVLVCDTSAVQAEGYAVYRKAVSTEGSEDVKWEYIGDYDPSAKNFTDDNLPVNATYYYTVIPYNTVDQAHVFGKFNYKGLSVTVSE